MSLDGKISRKGARTQRLKIVFSLLLLVFVPIACAGAPSVEQANYTYAPSFDDVIDRDWVLVELRVEVDAKRDNVILNREKLTAEGFGNTFTLRFDIERVGGAGAPNRFFAPYTLASNQAITIGMLAATLMAAIRQPEELREHEFFELLQNVSKWDIVAGSLELHSQKDGDSEVVLVFALSH